jgi:hypothetical protein
MGRLQGPFESEQAGEYPKTICVHTHLVVSGSMIAAFSIFNSNVGADAVSATAVRTIKAGGSCPIWL